MAAAHREHAPVEMAAHIALPHIDRGKRRDLPERIAPAMHPSFGVDPGEVAVEQAADRLSVSAAEAGDERPIGCPRGLLVIDGTGAAKHKAARDHAAHPEARDYEGAHASCSPA